MTFGLVAVQNKTAFILQNNIALVVRWLCSNKCGRLWHWRTHGHLKRCHLSRCHCVLIYWKHCCKSKHNDCLWTNWWTLLMCSMQNVNHLGRRYHFPRFRYNCYTNFIPLVTRSLNSNVKDISTWLLLMHVSFCAVYLHWPKQISLKKSLNDVTKVYITSH